MKYSHCSFHKILHFCSKNTLEIIPVGISSKHRLVDWVTVLIEINTVAFQYESLLFPHLPFQQDVRLLQQ